MKRLFIYMAVCLSLFFHWSIPLPVAAAPALINYQGKLSRNDSGEPFNGTATMVFAIWDDAVSTDTAHLLWSESRDVTIANGIYSLQLGELTPFPARLFDTSDLWLAVIVNSEILTGL